MVTPTARAVVLVSFPFSDLSNTKLRPAIVLADAGMDDWVLCQITSKAYRDKQAIVIEDDNFDTGSLRRTSYVRPGKLFTANDSIIKSQVGYLEEKTFRDIIDAVITVLRSSLASESPETSVDA